MKPHDFYEREDKNIKTEVELTLSEALLGTAITISTVHGPLTIQVEPGVCSGDQMVLKHYGVPEFDPPDNYDEMLLRGDHIVTFKVILPDYNSDANPAAADSNKSQREIDKILTQILENETNNSDLYYSYYRERRKQR
mgnify:CR=1 FL=1